MTEPQGYQEPTECEGGEWCVTMEYDTSEQTWFECGTKYEVATEGSEPNITRIAACYYCRGRNL